MLSEPSGLFIVFVHIIIFESYIYDMQVLAVIYLCFVFHVCLYDAMSFVMLIYLILYDYEM